LNPAKIAAFIRSNQHNTVVGDVRYGKDGEWAESRILTTQFLGVDKPGDVNEFTDPKKEIVLAPTKYKTGDMVYPFEKALKK